MKLINYISSLLPVFGKSQLLESLRITRGNYAEMIGELSSTEAYFKGMKFKSQEARDFTSTYNSLVKDRPSGSNFVTHFIESIPLIIKNLDFIESMVSESLEANIAGKGITYRTATLIQMVEALEFTGRYGVKLINYIYVSEVNAERAAQPNDSTEPTTPFEIAELEWISEGMVPYCVAMNAITKAQGDVEKMITDIPEIVITDTNYGTLSRTLGEKSIDPMNFEATRGFRFNPIYHIKMARAENAHQRYLETKHTLQVLKLRKLQLEKARTGKSDARLEREIAALQSRIAETSQMISEMEGK